MDKLQIEYLPIEKLKPYDKNARLHTDSDVNAIKNSIEQFGFNDPIGIWGKDNTIVEGHGRLIAAKKLGYKEVPIIRLDKLTDDERKAYTLVHNRSAELSQWSTDLLDSELDDLNDLFDMSDFGFDEIEEFDFNEDEKEENEVAAACQHNVFENLETAIFPQVNKYGIPQMKKCNLKSNKMIRFCDWKDINVEQRKDFIAHFYYDDYKFIQAWREPNKYIDRLKEFKAVISPDFSLYTDFPLTLQILSCYRRQWCGAFWQSKGIEVIPDVVWGEEKTFEFCFDGIPKFSTVAVSTVGVKNDKDWNNKDDNLFMRGYNEMLRRLEPKTILFYGSMIDGMRGNIIRIPSYYESKFRSK